MRETPIYDDLVEVLGDPLPDTEADILARHEHEMSLEGDA